MRLHTILYNVSKNHKVLSPSHIDFPKHKSHIVYSSKPEIIQPQVPVHHYIWENLTKWQHQVAIECSISGKKYTYNQLFTQCKRLGSSLQKLGINKGKTLGICLPNIPEFPVAYLGSMEAGISISSMNPYFTVNELGQQVQLADISSIICHPKNLPVVKELKNKLKKNITIICTNGLNQSPPSTEDQVISFENLISDSIDSSGRAENSDIDCSRTIFIPFSSGTTGLPKGVCLSHGNITASLEQNVSTGKWIETHGNHQDVIPLAIPLFHNYGLIVMLTSLRHGAKVITMPKYNSSSLLRIIQDSANVFLFGVPTMMQFLGSSIEAQSFLRSIREIVVSATFCSATDIEKIRNKTTAVITQGFGMTEMTGIVSWATGINSRGLLSAGTIVGSTQSKIVCPETGINRKFTETGEICFRGPQMMQEYLNNPEATEDTIDQLGWLHTGDIGHFDDTGNLYVTDRVKDLIKTNGYQVAPGQIEIEIKTIPGVEDAAVVGAPCSIAGETPVAFVKTESNVNLKEQDIIEFIRSRVSKHKQITSVRFTDCIPRSAVGKVLRRKLKTLL